VVTEYGGEMSETIRFTLNGNPVTLETDASRTLLWVLRTDLELTGTKYGCGAGFCGSCTVVVDGEAVRSCTTDLKAVQGKQVTTIEGLATNGRLHPLQQAFYELGGFQCGYCTPGMIMNAYALLLERPDPTREQIVQGMETNLCRCSAYKRIVEAIEMASAEMGGSHE
jgi:aerobic-type carbon monoxide dehydrogenase small subunit (CoxS/CutS family)